MKRLDDQNICLNRRSSGNPWTSYITFCLHPRFNFCTRNVKASCSLQAEFWQWTAVHFIPLYLGLMTYGDKKRKIQESLLFRECLLHATNCVAGENSIESPLDNKEIKPVNPKGKHFWIFIARTDAETEAPILWLPHTKSQLIRKNPGCWEALRAAGEAGNRGWDGWMASPT